MITFDEERHLYRNARGTLVPGVTYMLRCVGAIPAPRPWTRRAMARGKAVHRAIELHLKGQLDLGTVGKGIMPYFEAALAWLEDNRRTLQRLRAEVVLEGSGGRYAGKADLLGWVPKPKCDCVVDWKTGEEEPWHRVQGALYALADVNVRKRGCWSRTVYLRADRSYRDAGVAGGGDFEKAIAVLAVFDLARQRHMEALERIGEEATADE